MDRLAMLRQIAASNPQDPFPRYGVAMELKKRGDLDDARVAFDELLEAHPDYLAAYLMAGNLAAEQGDPTRAAALYDRGMDVARDKGDEHTLSELQGARAELG